MENQLIIYIKTPEELQMVVKAFGRITMICYSDWCPASLKSKMYFEDLAETYHTKCGFAKVIVDEFPILGQALRIEAIPTFFFIKEGNVVGRISGSIPYGKLEKLITELISSNSE